MGLFSHCNGMIKCNTKTTLINGKVKEFLQTIFTNVTITTTTSNRPCHVALVIFVHTVLYRVFF